MTTSADTPFTGKVRDAFETVDCSRCGGSGEYSWNAMTGSRCFKCGGSGWTFTKRGQAAYDFYVRSLSVTVEELQPGMKVKEPGGPLGSGGWCEVAAVEEDVLNPGQNRVNIRYVEGSPVGLRGAFHGTVLRVAQKNEAKREKMLAAIAYQATLTKSGTPRKAKGGAS